MSDDDFDDDLPALVVRDAEDADREVLAAMYAAYLADIAPFRSDPDHAAPLQDDWFGKPEALFPHVLELDDEIVGMALVLGAAYARAVGHAVDFEMHDFWIEPDLRGAGVAERALRWLLALHPGEWAVVVLPANGRALAFWRRALAAADVTGLREETEAEGLVLLRFAC